MERGVGGTPCSEHSTSRSTSSNIDGGESDLGGNCGDGGICGLPRQVRDSEPERTRNLEPGTKWSLPDDKLLLTAAAFQVTKDDVMENVGDDYETLGTLDTGENRVRGLEFSVVGNVTDDLSFVVATAMAADALEAGFVASTLSSVALEAIAAELHGPKWFQLYCQPTRERRLALVRRAEAAGFRESINSEPRNFPPAVKQGGCGSGVQPPGAIRLLRGVPLAPLRLAVPRGGGVRAGMAESTLPRRGVESIRFGPADVRDRRDDELGNPRAARDRHRRGPQVDDQHVDLVAVVGVDGAGCVEQAESAAQGEPAARTELGFVACGDGQREAGRNQGATQGFEHDVGRDVGRDVHPGRAGRHVARQRKRRVASAQPRNRDDDCLIHQ